MSIRPSDVGRPTPGNGPITRSRAGSSMNSKRRRKNAMADESNRDYDIGYGKPPKHSQFAKGRSGNPHGRPKRSIKLSTLLYSTLNESVIVNENGKRKRI